MPHPSPRPAGQNRLKDEPSLYLRQHADNPIDWHPWDGEALAAAVRLDRPIFLSVGYASCHWCHVMEDEVFRDEEVAGFLNRHFICIKVDREERPDLDRVYMEAVQTMTGRGGWPMSVFLTPDRRPFYGGTYFPRPQFLGLIRQIVGVFAEKRDALEDQAAELAAAIENQPAARIASAGEASGELADAAAIAAKEYFDPVHAGFNQRQKFPTPVKWRFLLHEYRRTHDADLAGMIVGTCEAVTRGGIYDHVGGGFHRYTVDPAWTVPHFEKMLYDNGQLAGLLLEAGAVFDRRDFTAAGCDVLDFLLRDMRGPEGCFYASYDADSGGDEGSFYVWSPQEIAAVAGPEDGPALAAVLGITPEGNFEDGGKSVITRRADLDALAADLGREPVELAALFDRHREGLQTARSRRTPPGLDRKAITAWNAMAITALCEGFAVTGRPEYLRGARDAAEFLLTVHRRGDGSLVRASTDGNPAGEGVLDDFAQLAGALLKLCQVVGDAAAQVRYLKAARDLVDFARGEFGRAEGGYHLSRAQVDAPLGRTLEPFDNVEPSGMSVLIHALIDLGTLTGEAGYIEEARAAIAAWTGLMQRAGLEMAWWCDAVRKLTEPYYGVVIAGGADRAHGLTTAFLGRLPHHAVLGRVPAGGASSDLAVLAPALGGKTELDGRAAAHVCEFGVCREPTAEVEVMLDLLGLV